jgi:hypothetical protein
LSVNYAALTAEINTDPRGYGYAAAVAAGSDDAVVQLLNAVRDGTNPPANPTAASGVASGVVTVRRNDISGAEILQAVDVKNDGAAGATNLQLQFFAACAGMRQLSFVNPDGTDNMVLSGLKTCFTANSPSRTNLTAISKRSGSRAEELFGTGVAVTDADVAKALGR